MADLSSIAWACPEHGCELRLAGLRLACAHGHEFPIINDIPRFVADGSYAASFGPQWQKYRLTQLDSFTRTTLSRQRTRRCVGERDWCHLDGADVLECGCGAGRFTEVLLAEGARVTSIDMTQAVEANRVNFPQNIHHRIAQADILNLPFAGNGFDIVICLGVLQHTPSTEQTLAALFTRVRPGGPLVVDHYRYRLGYFMSTQPLARAVLRRLPADVGLRATDRLVSALWPMHLRLRRYRKILNSVSRLHLFRLVS